MVILVLIAACSVYVSNGGLSVTEGTATVVTPLITTIAAANTEVIDLTVTEEEINGDQGGNMCGEEATATVAVPITEDPIEIPTETATIIVTEDPTEVYTNTPTATLEPPTFTPTAIPPTATPSFTPTPTTSPLSFALQSGSPSYIKNFAHSGKGCNWAGVAGQVFDSDGNPLMNYIIKITGKYNGVAIKKVAVTGMVNGTPYGPGSYEIVLGSSAIKTTGKLFIQLFTPEGKALTDKISFNTSANCGKNLIIINFKQN